VEKSTPHCRLGRVRELVAAGRVEFTVAARRGASQMGFGEDGVYEVLMRLTTADFYKSMTTYHDHAVWQDVYRPVTRHGAVYLKLTVTDDVLVVSFKER